MEVFPAWYERYKGGIIRRHGDLGLVPLRYYPDYYKVVEVIEASFTDHILINDVSWDQLVEADRRITRRSLERVYDCGWEGQEKLMAVLQELILEGKKPFRLDDYL